MDQAQIDILINQGKQKINKRLKAQKEKAIREITQEKNQNYIKLINELEAISQENTNTYHNLEQQQQASYKKTIEQIKSDYSLQKDEIIRKFNDELMKSKADNIKKIDGIYQTEKKKI